MDGAPSTSGSSDGGLVTRTIARPAATDGSGVFAIVVPDDGDAGAGREFARARSQLAADRNSWCLPAFTGDSSVNA